MVGSTCSLVWERRTTCWVTMRVPDPNIPIVRRPLPVREGRDLDHHVTACSEGAGVRGHAGGGGAVLGLLSAPFLLGGGGAAKGLLPRFVVAEIWADKGGGGGWGGRPPARPRVCVGGGGGSGGGPLVPWRCLSSAGGEGRGRHGSPGLGGQPSARGSRPPPAPLYREPDSRAGPRRGPSSPGRCRAALAGRGWP